MYNYMYVRTRMGVRVCIYVCTRMGVRVCIYVCTCMDVCTYGCVYICNTHIKPTKIVNICDSIKLLILLECWLNFAVLTHVTTLVQH